MFILGCFSGNSILRAEGGFAAGFADALSEGIKRRDRQRYERELLELQLNQRNRELEIQREIEANRLKQLEIIQQQSQQSQQSQQRLPYEKYMIDRAKRLNRDLYVLENTKLIVETQYCNYDIDNADVAIDARNRNSMIILFIEKSIMCTVLNIK